MIVGSVAGLAAGMAGGGWINELWGWRTAFLVAGVPGLVLAAVFRLTVDEPARGASGERETEPEPTSSWLEDSRYLLSLPSMRWLIVANSLAVFFAIGKNSWEPTFIRRVYDMGSGAAGTWYFLTSPLPSVAGLLLGGWWCDRWSSRDLRGYLWVQIIGQVATVPFLLAFLLWPQDQRIDLPLGLPPLPVAFLFSIGSSVLASIYSGPMLAAVQALARPRMRASAAALMAVTSTAVGSSLGPVVIGELNMRLQAVHGDEAVRWALAWSTIAMALCVAAIAAALPSIRSDVAKAQ
jgi:sugar phosphate permease